MTDSSSNNKRIAKNTIYLYCRTFFVMLVSIYTSRVVLDALGVEDFGIYNVVGGFVMMFSLLSSTLTASTQRFISYEMGKDNPLLSKVFSAALSIHLILAVVILLLFETFGLWFLNSKMNIASERMDAANWVFQCSALAFCVQLISIPYNALIISHERMDIFAYISIYEVCAKLGIAYLLTLSNYDKLVVYAILMFGVALSLRLIYGLYCQKHFPESIFRFLYEKALYVKMLSFSSWNFIGSTAGILNTQGINVLINFFFGVTLNAARGIAVQVDTAINGFVLNFMTALNPQITKSFAAGNYSHMVGLMCKGGKYAAYLFWLISLPIFLETEYILDIWLKKVPDYAPIFVRYVLIFSLCQTLSQTLYIGMLATGKIKKYQMVVGTLSLMAFPTTYVFYRMGYPAEWGYIATIFFSIVCLVARLFMLQEIIPTFSWRIYTFKTILRVLSVVIVTFAIMYLLHEKVVLVNKLANCCVMLTFSLFLTSLAIYILGLEKTERAYTLGLIRKKITRII